MPFTGNPVFANVARNLVRITGLSLDPQAVGTIGLNGDAGADVELPDEFNPGPYGDIDLAEAIEVNMVQTNLMSQDLRVRVTKAVGPPFRITMTNDAVGLPAVDLEIWVRFH